MNTNKIDSEVLCLYLSTWLRPGLAREKIQYLLKALSLAISISNLHKQELDPILNVQYANNPIDFNDEGLKKVLMQVLSTIILSCVICLGEELT